MSTKYRPTWDAEDLRKIVELAKANVLLEEVYEAFPDRTPRAILARLNKQGVKRKDGRLVW